jgi:hypothetical protein
MQRRAASVAPGWRLGCCGSLAAIAGGYFVSAAFCARSAFFSLILSLIFRYCETQATLLITTTAIARHTTESMIMVRPFY